MQRYQLYLGSPVYAIVVVLTAMFLFSGLGSWASQYAPRWAKRSLAWSAPFCILPLIAGLSVLFEHTQSQPFAVRVALALGSLAPSFVVMGIPFPFGLESARSKLGRESVPLFYGVAGMAGAVAVPLTFVVSAYFGLTTIIWLGASLYTVAALIGDKHRA